MKVAMIPARMGSQRLKRKNLEMFGGVTLIEHAILRCKEAAVFDEIYVNSESDVFEGYALKHGVKFYKRPAVLGNHTSTSEDFVFDFFNNVECTNLYQIHSITPLLSANEISEFFAFCESSDHDTVLSCIHDQIEVAFNGAPVNFNFTSKTNSQELSPVQRVTWAATKWSRDAFLCTVHEGGVGTYSGRIGFFPVGPFTGLAIKTSEDLRVANALRGVFDA